VPRLSFPFKKIVLLLSFILLILSLLLNFFLLSELKKGKEGIKVLGVIDGDTLVLEGKTRLRLRCVDAPSIEFCGGPEAKKALEELVSGKKVLVKEKIIDVKGRPMALVYVNGILVNQEILKAGWGRFHSDNVSVREELKTTSERARKHSLGIFSEKCRQRENPDNPECNIKGNIDKSENTRLYYYPGCAQYDFTIVEKDIGEKWFCTEEEAKTAGFTKAKTCP